MIIDWLEEWFKGVLIDGIIGNLSGLFDTVNTKVGEIAADVGATPQGWNSGIFNMIRNLSESVIIPIAGAILAFVMTYELIQMVTEKNNLHDIDTFMFFKWVFKTYAAVLIVTNTWNIVMGVFDAAQQVVNQSAGVIIGNTSIDIDSLVGDLQTSLEAMSLGGLIGLWFQSLFVGLTMNILSICIMLVVYGRMIEIYLVTSLGPIPLATMTNGEWRNVGQNYLKSLLALGFQAFLMNKFENVDVLASLQQIMQQNTAAFQNDFDIDKKILTQAAKSKNAEDKVYLWFSRPNGTHCLRERDVFLRGTREHNTFRFYHEQTKERVLAYAVVLSGMESGKVKGSIYELDYAAKAELAIQTALRTDNNRLIYENGSRELPKECRFEATPDWEYGKFVRYEAVPHDPDALRDLLRDESRKRERLKPGNFKEHIGRLSDEKVLAEAQRLSAAFQSLQAPNGPNGTHFVVEVSPWFERIASSREHERLFALLPYKTLYLSSVKDRHGVFAFISKDERRDLPLRKQRPSVRAQLKEGQSKKAAAPKKAAAKAKDNDLEV